MCIRDREGLRHSYDASFRHAIAKRSIAKENFVSKANCKPLSHAEQLGGFFCGVGGEEGARSMMPREVYDNGAADPPVGPIPSVFVC